MSILGFLSMLLPGVIHLAEELFMDKPGSGKEKKEAVTDTAKAILDALQTYSTGGQKHTWERIAPTVSNMIDDTASLLFSHEG